jgi:hypothetical protein
VGAWKLRAVVYGMLAVVSALVLWQSGALADEPERPHLLSGTTDQGYKAEFEVLNGRVTGFVVHGIVSRCGGGRWWRVRWYPATSPAQGNVTYQQQGGTFSVHEQPMAGYGDTLRYDVNGYMRGAVAGDDEAVSGTLWYTGVPNGVRCESGTVRFAASR